MMQCRAILRSGPLRRTTLSAVRRFKATLQVEQERPDEHRQIRDPATGKQTRFKVLESRTAALVSDVKLGKMDATEWGHARDLVFENCKKSKPHYATQLLYRMLEESSINERGFELYGSLFNVTISAWSRAHDAEQAEEVFYKMILGHSENPDRCPRPDRYSYNALLTAWAGSESSIAIDRVLEILQEMEESDEDVQPDAYTYNIVMSCYANRVGEYGAAKAAEDILLRFSERHVQGALEEGPQTMSFNIVMKAWSNSQDEKGPDRAMEIFNLMEKLHAEGHEHVKPDGVSLLALMTAYARKGDAHMAEKLLRESNIDDEITKCYNCAITAHALSGRPDAGDRAEALLAEMDGDAADESTYATVLNAHASSDRPDAAHRCEDFLGRTIEGYLKYQMDMRPSKKFFHIVLRAWEKHGDAREAAERASALVEDMQGLAKEWKLQTKPNEGTYSILVGAWCKVDGDRAKDVLQQMENDGFVPWARTHNLVIAALVTKGTKASIEKALKVLARLEHHHGGNTSAYNQIIFALKRPDVTPAYRKKISLVLLARMEEGFQEGNEKVQPSMLTYSTILDFLSDNVRPKDVYIAETIFSRMKSIHDDPTLHATLPLDAHRTMFKLLAWAGSAKAANLADDLLEQMLSPDYHLYPCGACMSNAIVASLRAPSGKYTQMGHDRLLELTKLHRDGKLKHYPFRSTFRHQLFAWSRCRDNNVVEKAKEVLQIMKDSQEDGMELDLRADMYSTYLSVLANSLSCDNGEEAEEILESLENPDAGIWNKVILVWARSKAADKAIQSLRCLRKMQDTEGAPNPDKYAYNAVLSAAAHTNSSDLKEEVFKIANELFQEMENSDSIKLDHVSYGTMMKCYSSLIAPSEERKASALAFFEVCKEKGAVGRMIIREIESVLTPKDFHEALGDSAEAFNENRSIQVLPKAWTRNVRERENQNVSLAF